MHKRTWAIAAVAAFFVLASASVLAYLRLIPKAIKDIPHYDSIGHFMLFGMLAFALDHALAHRTSKFIRRDLPLGSMLVAVYATLDESAQYYSSARTFDLGDLSFSLFGIVMFYIVTRIMGDNTQNPGFSVGVF